MNASIWRVKAFSVVVNLRVGPMLIWAPVTTVLGVGSSHVGAWAVAVVVRLSRQAATAICFAWRVWAVGGWNKFSIYLPWFDVFCLVAWCSYF